MVAELIGKYIWLVRTVSAAGPRGLSFEEICLKHQARWYKDYPRRTFNNHRTAVEEVFGISIECDRTTNRYFIPYSEDALDRDDSLRWLINTFTVSSLLTLRKERLSGRVAVEEVPSGQKHLTAILQAMEEGEELRIEYSKYKASQSETLHVQPFAVKEHGRRWYLVGYCHERAAAAGKAEEGNESLDFWRVYALDRIISLEASGQRFKVPRGFDIDDLFSQSYGIFFPKVGQRALTVRFRATEEEAKYLRDLPLHGSQVEERDSSGPVFSIRVIPNRNLTMDLCAHGDRIEVLEPESVRADVAAELRKAAGLYG